MPAADTLHVVGWLDRPRTPTAEEVAEVCNSDTDPNKKGLGCVELRGKDWKIYAHHKGNGNWNCNHWAFLTPPHHIDLNEDGSPLPYNHWIMNSMWESLEEMKKAR